MKCAACNYEHKPDETVEVPVFYLRGPKAGQVRTTEKHTKRYPKFKEIEIQRGALNFDVHNGESWSSYPYDRVSLYACPECGTVRLG